MTKICNKCNLEKEIEFFYRRSENKYRNECIECLSSLKKERYLKNRESVEFVEKINEKSRNYKNRNKKIVLEKSRNYYKNNKHDILNQQKYYYELNKKSKMERRKLYRLENKEELNKKSRDYLKNNPLKRLVCNIRTLIGNSLAKKGYSKKSKTQEILGCSFIEFKSYLESKFLTNMNWENRNEWHIDHIIPLDFAINESEILKLNHFSNLRPLWIKDNLEKSNNIIIKNEIYYEIIESRNYIISSK